MNEWPMNEYQTKHLLNMSHNIIIEALKKSYVANKKYM